MTVHPHTSNRRFRPSDDPRQTSRRWLVGLSVVGSAAGLIVALYQWGALRRLSVLREEEDRRFAAYREGRRRETSARMIS